MSPVSKSTSENSEAAVSLGLRENSLSTALVHGRSPSTTAHGTVVDERDLRWSRLTSKIKQIEFGSIFNLHIRDGAPDLSNPVRIEYSRRFDSSAVSKPSPGTLRTKPQFVLFRRLCERERNVVIAVLTIQNGLPLQAKYEKEEAI
jgi:hypothetical protein